MGWKRERRIFCIVEIGIKELGIYIKVYIFMMKEIIFFDNLNVKKENFRIVEVYIFFF